MIQTNRTTRQSAQQGRAPIVVSIRQEHGLATYARVRRRLLGPLRRRNLDVVVKLECERSEDWTELLRFCCRVYRQSGGVLLIVAPDCATMMCAGLLCFPDERQAGRMLDLVRADRLRREVAGRLAP